MTIVLDPLPPPPETQSPEISTEVPTVVSHSKGQDIISSSVETPVEENSTLRDSLTTVIQEATNNSSLDTAGLFASAENETVSRTSTTEYLTDTNIDIFEEETTTDNYTSSEVTLGMVEVTESTNIFSTEKYVEDYSSLEDEAVTVVSTTTAEDITSTVEVESNSTHMPTTSNPYNHWDADSAEQELEMEMGRSAEINSSSNPEDNVGSYDDYDDPKEAPPSSATTTLPPFTQRSYILQLAGNSTIVKLRQNDFAKYLKLNLAARLSLEYDNVKVNRVVLEPPKLLVNVSVVTPSGLSSDGAGGGDNVEEEEEEEPLHLMAETNATLLELSGEEYHVVRMLPLRTRPTVPDVEDTDDGPDDLDEAAAVSDRHSDIEFVIFTVLGGACAAVIAVTIVLTAFRYLRRLSDAGVQWLPPWQLRVPHHRMGDASTPAPSQPPPTVIYSGSFAARAPAWRTEEPIGVPELEMEGGVPVLFLPPPTSLPSSKLQIFNCNAKNLLIPLPTPQRSCAHKDTVQTQEVRAGHDNPNYCG